MSAEAPAPAAAAAAPAAPKEEVFADSILTKYKAAGDIAARGLKEVISKAVDGAGVLDLCKVGDALIESATKGVYKNDKKMAKGSAFPTTVSINNTICNYAPLPTDPDAARTLKAGDVVKVQIGAHIDGYAAVAGETIVVGASSVDGTTADAIQAAVTGAEVALRLMRPGAISTEIAKKVESAIKEFGVRAVEGMQSNLMDKNVIDGAKKIVLNPDPGSKPDTVKLEENEVYGVDITVTTSKDGKPKTDEAKTSIYKKTGSRYILKMATSRKVFSEVEKAAGAFPFNLRVLEDEKRAKIAMRDCINHNLVSPFEVLEDRDASAVTAQVFFTVVINAKGAIRLTPATQSHEGVKSQAKLSDELAKLLETPIRETKKTKKAAAAKSAEATKA